MQRDDLTFFESAGAFRDWLAANHTTAPVLHLGYYKKGTKRSSISYPESVDEALCFGWIDGVRHAVDAESYTVRFTPRRVGSIWSAINLGRVEALLASSRMTPAGIAAYEARDPAKAGLYSFEQATAALSPAYEAQIRADAAAWAFFEAQPPGYRRLAAWWVTSAKQEATRQKRLAILIEDSAAGRRLGVTQARREEKT